MSDVQEVLAAHLFLSRIEPAAQAALAAVCTLCHSGKGEQIYREAEPAINGWLLARGEVKLVKYSTRGETLLLEIIIPHEIFGMIFYRENPRYPCAAVAMGPVEALKIPTIELHRLLDRHPPLQKEFLAETCRNLCHAQHMRGLGREEVSRRLASALLYLREKFGAEIPHTRATLAGLAGTSVETAIRLTRAWREQGILETARGSVKVLSPRKLEELALPLMKSPTR